MYHRIFIRRGFEPQSRLGDKTGCFKHDALCDRRRWKINWREGNVSMSLVLALGSCCETGSRMGIATVLWPKIACDKIWTEIRGWLPDSTPISQPTDYALFLRNHINSHTSKASIQVVFPQCNLYTANFKLHPRSSDPWSTVQLAENLYKRWTYSA